MEISEKDRLDFEEQIFLDYFIRSIGKNPDTQPRISGCMDFISNCNFTKTEFCERDGEDYKRTEVSAMWHGWKLCLENSKKHLASQKLHAWDFIFSNGDTIKDKMFDLFSKVSVLCVRSEVDKMPTSVSCNKEMCAALTVSAVRDNIEFINKYEKLENGLMWAGQIKKSCGSNGYCTDFDLYEDPQMEKDEIIICIGNQTSVLKIFNYPFTE